MKNLHSENAAREHEGADNGTCEHNEAERQEQHAHRDHFGPEREGHQAHYDHREPQRDDCFVAIEGREYPWPQRTITVEEIRELGQLPVDQPVIEIDPDCVEHQLPPCAVVTLKRGHCYGKKPRFKRGQGDRMREEVALIQRHFPQAEQFGAWIKIPGFAFTPSHWSRESGTICFEAPVGYPGNPPYSFYVEGGLRLGGTNGLPQNYQEPAATPFPGIWGKFSWGHDGSWRPAGDVVSGNNLLNFVLTFSDRLREAI